jgi:hypothetical protein
MNKKRESAVIVLLALSASICKGIDSPDVIKTLSTLYEDCFQGSREISVAKNLMTLKGEAKKIFEIGMSGKYPFTYGAYQFKDNYEYLRITNDDATIFYLDTMDMPRGEGYREDIVGVTYNKITKKVDIISGVDDNAYLRDYIWGYYKKRTSERKGALSLSLNTDRGQAELFTGDELLGGDIANPKNVDDGENIIFLSDYTTYKCDFNSRGQGRDLELLIFDWAEEKLMLQLDFPFSEKYTPIYILWHTYSNQSVANQNYVYFVLSSNIASDQTIKVPKTPNRWHVLIYDVKGDTLYSVWHGMDESDGLKELSFSYYLGKDGLYFEVLKEKKIEVYLLDIDLKKAAPLKEYETVDLLWNKYGLKKEWEQKIKEAKAKDPKFEERWESPKMR